MCENVGVGVSFDEMFLRGAPRLWQLSSLGGLCCAKEVPEHF